MKEGKRKRSIKSSKNSPRNPLNQWKVEATINYLETKKGSILKKKKCSLQPSRGKNA
jgi:hypothetical protein